MATSAYQHERITGELCFGIGFRAGASFPWNPVCEMSGSHIDFLSWWRHSNGYRHLLERKDGTCATYDMVKFWEHRDQWDANHPVPAVYVEVGGSRYPASILAVPSSCTTCDQVVTLEVADEEVEVLMKFCSDYEIEIHDDPRWWLITDTASKHGHCV